MKFMIAILVFLLSANWAGAETVKEKLRRARAEEALHKTAPSTAPSIPATKNDVPPACSDKVQSNGFLVYHQGCYCRNLKYPRLDDILSDYGLTYVPKGIQELGTGVIQFTTTERNELYYLCGAELDWDPKDTRKFSSKQDCTNTVDEVLKKIAGNPPVLASAAYAGCDAQTDPETY